MPTKMAILCREKAVLITVYVEKPRRRHHYHHHYLRHINSREVIRGSGKGYNRRAELLRYSQSLRESARTAASSLSSSSATTLLLTKPTSPKSQQPPTETVDVFHRKASYPRTPTCLGYWKLLIPSFIWSLMSPKAKKTRKKKKHGRSTTSKVEAPMKSFEIQKKKKFIIPKLFSAFRKYR